MIIHFKKQGDKFVTETGVEVDRGLISTFPHKYNPDGSGQVTVPECLFGGSPVSVDFIGTKVYPVPTKKVNTAPYVSYPGITPERNGKPTAKSNTTLKQIGAIQGDIPGKTLLEKSQEQVYKDHMKNAIVAPINEPEELKDLDDDSIFGEDYALYYAKEVMNALGFQDRELARWWHPVFGDDQEWNWLYFDPHTDSLQSIVVKAFKTGRVQGQRGIRNDIKAALDIR